MPPIQISVAGRPLPQCEIAKAALRLPVTEPLVRFCVRQYAKRLAAARHEVAVPMVTVSDLIAQHKLE